MAELDIKQSDFESGKVQLVSDFWGGGGDPWVFFSAFDPFTVIKAPVAQNPIIANGFDKDIVVELTKPVTEISVENAADTKVTLEKDIDYTVSGNMVTIKKEFIAGKPINYFKADTQLIFETADSRTASLALNILYYDPPVYTQSGGGCGSVDKGSHFRGGLYARRSLYDEGKRRGARGGKLYGDLGK